MQHYEGSAIKKVEEGRERREGSRRRKEKKGEEEEEKFQIVSCIFS